MKRLIKRFKNGGYTLEPVHDHNGNTYYIRTNGSVFRPLVEDYDYSTTYVTIYDQNGNKVGVKPYEQLYQGKYGEKPKQLVTKQESVTTQPAQTKKEPSESLIKAQNRAQQWVTDNMLGNGNDVLNIPVAPLRFTNLGGLIQSSIDLNNGKNLQDVINDLYYGRTQLNLGDSWYGKTAAFLANNTDASLFAGGLGWNAGKAALGDTAANLLFRDAAKNVALEEGESLLKKAATETFANGWRPGMKIVGDNLIQTGKNKAATTAAETLLALKTGAWKDYIKDKAVGSIKNAGKELKAQAEETAGDIYDQLADSQNSRATVTNALGNRKRNIFQHIWSPFKSMFESPSVEDSGGLAVKTAEDASGTGNIVSYGLNQIGIQ